MIADTGGHSVTEQYIMAERDSLPAFFIPNRCDDMLPTLFSAQRYPRINHQISVYNRDLSSG